MPFGENYLEFTCIECGRHFFDKCQQKKCEECRKSPLVKRKPERVERGYTLIADPTGDFILGSQFGEMDIKYGVEMKSWCAGTTFRHGKTKRRITVKY